MRALTQDFALRAAPVAVQPRIHGRGRADAGAEHRGHWWRPFPGARDAAQLAVLEMVTAAAPNGASQVSYLDYRDYRGHLQSLSGLAVHH